MVGVKLEPYHKGEGERVIRVEIGAPAEGSHAIKGAFFFSTHMASQGYDADAASWTEDKTTLVPKSHLLFNLCFLTSLRKYCTLFRHSQKQRHFKSFQSFLKFSWPLYLSFFYLSSNSARSMGGGRLAAPVPSYFTFSPPFLSECLVFIFLLFFPVLPFVARNFFLFSLFFLFLGPPWREIAIPSSSCYSS